MDIAQLKAENAALRAQRQLLQDRADTMADLINEMYNDSDRAGSPIVGLRAIAVDYWQFLQDQGLPLNNCPLLRVVNQ